MPKIPYKSENTNDDDDYEIVSFEDFCDKSPGSKTDLLTLNDNINYRLCYEADKTAKFENAGETSRDSDKQTETSLGGAKNETCKRKLSGSFSPFGRSNGKAGKGSLFSGVIPKARSDVELNSREQHRYQRFSGRRGWQSWRECMPGLGPGVMAVALVCALCVGVWWAVCGALGGSWGEEHYRKLWERAHPDTVQKPIPPIPYEKFNHQQVLPEYRYHDHNNLSAKNKLNATEASKKKDFNKKLDSELTDQMDVDACAVVVDDNKRFDCYPQDDASEELCESRGCCWHAATTQGAPYCYYPPRYMTYKFANMTENTHEMTAYYNKVRNSQYPGDFETVRIDFKYISADALQIKITDADNKRFEVPIPEVPIVGASQSTLRYRVLLSDTTAGFKVVRNSDNVTVINTVDVGALILSEKFLQISSRLPTGRIYGLGEHRDSFRRDVNWRTYTMFNRDHVPAPYVNGYGSHPFYLAVENSGKSHGMLLLNSNAMDVVLQPTPAITYRTIGGVLNLLLFLGPSPREVIQQYTASIGRPAMPPYWGLGFHLCRYGYNDLNTTRRVWRANRDAGIPFDVQWNDIDYMVTQNDFTYDKQRFRGLPQFVDTLHAVGMHYVMILDPGVSASERRGSYPPFDRGLEMNVFIKNSTGQPFIGKVWNPVSTVFPDFTHPNSTPYWVEMMQNYHHYVAYDGAWIDMNEISNFLDGQKDGECEPEDLPYKPKWIPREGLKSKTLCMDAKHHIGRHYDVHNIYALAEAIATNFALAEIRGKRPFVISRASFPGLGRHAGHWSGDVASTWDDMRMSIPDLLRFSLFGIPLMGADICGFNGNTTEELCTRWHQLGAFYPFSRNHNTIGARAQDPVSLGAGVVSAASSALRLRYALLPLYYTMFWRAHTLGDTVATPLFFEDPSDRTLHDIDTQFLIGSNVMITPLLQTNATTKAWFPGIERWYSIRDGRYLGANETVEVGEYETVSVRGGAIIPMQTPTAGPVTTASARSRPMQLLVVPDDSAHATGELYWDDGDSLNSYEERKYSHIEFNMAIDLLTSHVEWWGYGVPLLVNVTVVDVPPVVSVKVNDLICKQDKKCGFDYDRHHRILHIRTLLSLDIPFTIRWLYERLNTFRTPNQHYKFG